MTPQRVGMIWAQSNTGAIGQAGRIPWQVPEDMARFREVTTGHPVVMGRKTWDSLPERFRPLPDRRNIVVTRNAEWTADGAERAGSVQEALNSVDGDTVWVLGGGQIYAAALPFATVIHLTEIDLDVDGDTTAPSLPADEWHADESEWRTSRNEGIRYRFLEYVKAYRTS